MFLYIFEKHENDSLGLSTSDGRVLKERRQEGDGDRHRDLERGKKRTDDK